MATSLTGRRPFNRKLAEKTDTSHAHPAPPHAQRTDARLGRESQPQPAQRHVLASRPNSCARGAHANPSRPRCGLVPTASAHVVLVRARGEPHRCTGRRRAEHAVCVALRAMYTCGRGAGVRFATASGAAALRPPAAVTAAPTATPAALARPSFPTAARPQAGGGPPWPRISGRGRAR